ncbi:ABC 3 transport family protein, partial [Chlamydia psittaci 06-1683]
LCLQVFLFIL